jgi:hypothetical protein
MEGAPALTHDNQRLYFHAYNDGISNVDLYYTDWDSISSWWGTRNHMGWIVNTPGFNDRYPSIQQDGITLYFDSDRVGGEGDYDIWETKFIGSSWMPPSPLSTTINSAGYEGAPYVYDGTGVRQLYFQKEYRGNVEIFVSDWDPISEEWKFPYRMCGDYIHSLSLLINSDHEEMMFQSDKPGGMGGMDIWIAECASTATVTPTPSPTIPVPMLHNSSLSKLILIFSICLVATIFTRLFHPPSSNS